MNANNWLLEDMQQAVYDVPLPLAVCQGQLEHLDEPKQKSTKSNRGIYRTRVFQVHTQPHESLYCVQRLLVHRKPSVYDTDAELNVRLTESGTGTRVTLYFTDTRTFAQKFSNKTCLVAWGMWFVVAVMFFLSIKFLDALGTVLIFAAFGLWSMVDTKRTHHKQQKALREVVWGAFDLDSTPYTNKTQNP